MENEQGIDDRIAALKKKSSEIRSEYLDSIEKIKRQIYPRKRGLQQELEEARRRMEQKQIELRDIRKNIDEINSLINKKERLSLTGEEIRVWGERLASLAGRNGAVEKEIDKLKKEIEITGLKM
ncbi:MAG: hypothetical protein KAS86_03780, partial [Candidatus Omnitrophica bacterium]|nr:hypothetical protein [Candidatus Omnitrophota bacterium]